MPSTTHPDRHSARKAAGFGAQEWESEAHRPADFQRLPYVKHLRNGGKPDTPGGAMGTVDSGAVDYVLKDGAGRVTRINATTREQLKKLIQEGLEQGLSAAELGDRIQASTAFSEYRAERIARTELMMAYNQASLASYGKHGIGQVEAADGDKDEECSQRDGKVYSVTEAMSIHDHPNGTLNWVPIASDLVSQAVKEQQDAADAAEAKKQAKIAAKQPPAPPKPSGVPKWDIKTKSFKDANGKSWYKNSAGEWSEDASSHVVTAPYKPKVQAKPKPNQLVDDAYVDYDGYLDVFYDTKTGYEVKWSTAHGGYIPKPGGKLIKPAGAPKPTPQPAALKPVPSSEIANIKQVPTSQSSSGYIHKTSGKPVKQLPDGTWVETGEATINPKGFHVWGEADGTFTDHLTGKPIKFNPTTKQWEAAPAKVKPPAASAPKPSAPVGNTPVDKVKRRSTHEADTELRGWQNKNPIGSAEKRAQRGYTSSGDRSDLEHGYGTVNGYLRGTSRYSAQKSRLIQDQVDLMSKGMRPLETDIRVMRGTGKDAFGKNLSSADFDALVQPGKAFIDDGFMSTSVSEHWSWSGDVQIELFVPKGTMAQYVQTFSYHTSEYELLLDKGTRIVIDSVQRVGYQWKVKAHVV